MLKKLFLRYKSKTQNTPVEHCTYQEASSVGILFNSDEYPKGVIDELTELLHGDGKQVGALGFEQKPDENSSFFSRKDISIIGEFKNETVKLFVNNPFDFLVSLDSAENMNYRFVLALCKSKCKVGIESQAYYELLHMALKQSATPEESMRSVVKYLKMI